MKTVNTIMGEFNFHRYNKLKSLYTAAILRKDNQFVEEIGIHRVNWHTNFAKYMIEFLDNNFKSKK